MMSSQIKQSRVEINLESSGVFDRRDGPNPFKSPQTLQSIDKKGIDEQLKDADRKLGPPGTTKDLQIASAQQSNLKGSESKIDEFSTPEPSVDQPQRGKRKRKHFLIQQPHSHEELTLQIQRKKLPTQQQLG